MYKQWWGRFKIQQQTSGRLRAKIMLRRACVCSFVLLRAALALHGRGAKAVVLGCTEIPLVLDSSNVPLPVIDATDSLARRVVAWSLSQRSAGRLA